MKRIAIGIDNFKEMRRDNFYYVDKTKFIEDILYDGSKVKLFTRPRRFGKTLNMSMLKFFFDIENKEENRKLFNDLYIEKSEYIKEQGQYPVIFISLKGIKGRNWEETKDSLTLLISELYSDYSYLLSDLDEFNIVKFKEYILEKIDLAYLKNSLLFLTKILYQKYKKEVVLLIDEYDSPLISAYEHNYYDEAITFFKVFFGEALKSNPYLKMGVMTGIIRVVKAGIFSDLNNLIVYSILSKDFSDYYGFTEEEVKESLKYYGLEYKIEEVKKWYDGYRIGNSEVYNPWSILNFLKNKELEAYWVGTSGNFLIKQVLEEATESENRSLEKLFNGESVEEIITGNSDLSVLLNHKEIWELLLFSGYLTIDKKIDEDTYLLRIPNKEIRKYFKEEFITVYFGQSLFRKTMEALRKGEIKDFENYLQEIIINSTSYMDGRNESFYHGLILGMSFYLDNNYYVTSNKESGNGRYDIMIEPKNKTKRAFILEFKIGESEENLEDFSRKGIEQIEEKQYTEELKKRGIEDILLIGIAFYKKKVKVTYK